MLQHFDNFFMLATPMNYFQKISYHAFWNKVSYFMDRIQFLIPFFTFKNTTINERNFALCIIEIFNISSSFQNFFFDIKKRMEKRCYDIYIYIIESNLICGSIHRSLLDPFLRFLGSGSVFVDEGGGSKDFARVRMVSRRYFVGDLGQ